MNLDSIIDPFLQSEAAQKVSASLGMSPEDLKGAATKMLPVALAKVNELRGQQGDDAVAGILEKIAIDPEKSEAAQQALEQPNDQVSALLGSKASLLTNLLGGGEQGQGQLGTLLPLLLGFLQKQGIGSTDAGGVLGGIAGFLDQDKDGDSLDDLASMVLGSTGEAKSSGGILNKILSLFGGKK